MTFEEYVERTIRAERLMRSGDHVLVALSGGRDSVALLAVLARLRERLGVEVSAHHVRHGLRASDGEDEALCVDVASKLGVSLTITRFAPGDVEALSGEGQQDQARQARYGALCDAADACGASVIATAHHGDDNLETSLLRMARGAGLDGVGGIRARRVLYGVRFVRPLLGVDRASITAWVHDEGLSYCDDPSNAKSVYMRNALRLELMPRLESLWGSGRVEAMRRSVRNLGRDAEALDVLTARCLEREVVRTEEPAYYLPAALCEALGEAACGRLMRLAARRLVVGHELSARSVEEGVLRLDAPGRQVWRDGRVALGRDGRFFVVRAVCAVDPEPLLRRALVLGRQRLGLCEVDVSGKHALPPGLGAVSCLEAERMVARGMDGHKRVRDVLREMGVPRPYRSLHPVIADAHGVWCVVGGPWTERGHRISREKGLQIELVGRPWYLEGERGLDNGAKVSIC